MFATSYKYKIHPTRPNEVELDLTWRSAVKITLWSIAPAFLVVVPFVILNLRDDKIRLVPFTEDELNNESQED